MAANPFDESNAPPSSRIGRFDSRGAANPFDEANAPAAKSFNPFDESNAPAARQPLTRADEPVVPPSAPTVTTPQPFRTSAQLAGVTPQARRAAPAPSEGVELKSPEEMMTPPPAQPRFADKSVFAETTPTTAPMDWERQANMSVLNPSFIKAVESQLNALPAAARNKALEAMVKRPDAYGRAAREVQSRYQALDKITNPEIKKRFDPRLESQTKRLVVEGDMDPQAAEFFAKRDIQRGLTPTTLPMAVPDVAAELAESERQRVSKELEDAGFAERVGETMTSRLRQSALGAGQIYADLTGDEGLQNRLRGLRQVEKGREAGIPEGESIAAKSAQQALATLTGQAPMIVLSALTGTAVPVLAQVGFESFTQAYGEARSAFKDPAEASVRAGLMTTAELVFARFGLGDQLKAIRGVINRVPTKELSGYLTASLIKEIPAEQATTLSQILIDKLPEVGMNPNAGMKDVFEAAAETLRQTVIQTGAANATIYGASAAERGYSTKLLPALSPERALARELERSAGAATDAALRAQSVTGRARPPAEEKAPPAEPAGRVEPTGRIEPTFGEPRVPTEPQGRIEPTLFGAPPAAPRVTPEEPDIVPGMPTGEEIEEPAGVTSVTPEGEQATEPAVGFTTAKGSTYTVNPDGTTTRTKAARPEHPGEEGIQPTSKRTVYVTEEDANKLAEIQAKGPRRTLRFDNANNQVGMFYLEGPSAGKLERRTVVNFQSEPAVGLTPVEYWGDDKTIHFGNKITEVRGKPATEPSTAKAQAPFFTPRGIGPQFKGSVAPTAAAARLPDTPTVAPTTQPKVFEPAAPQHQDSEFPSVDIPLNKLKLSEEVPQFKYGANAKGVVRPLGGEFSKEGLAPIAVWERLDGSLEIISGRHRFDLAQRSGKKTIPSQIYRERDGFTAVDAAIKDAELNIRDDQGQVKDYVNYFKESGMDRETAESKGLLARDKGKRGFTIGNQGSDELIEALRADQITDTEAYYIALNAPNDSRLQAVGIKAIMDGKSANVATNMMQAVKALAVENNIPWGDGSTGDIWGFDDSAIKEAVEMAQIAQKKQREVADRLSAITGAAKRPEIAKAEGIDIKDPEAVKRRIDELRNLKSAWDNWATNSELIAQIREARGVEAPQPFGLVAQTPEELEAQDRERQEREAAERAEKEARERKAKADEEVGEFVLTGSDREADEAAARGQEDLFAAPPAKKGKAKKEPVSEPSDINETGFRGASDADVKKVGDEFESAADRNSDEESVTKVFEPPTKNEIVGIADKVRVYVSGKGYMTVAEAKKQIQEWKNHTRAQGKTGENGDKVVLSLFDMTGEWSKPWEEAGYQVFRFDIQNDPELGDVNNFDTEFFADNFGMFEGQDVYAILAACPCTDFASSGAKHFAAKDRDGRTRKSVELVRQTLAAIEFFKPSVWAIENPVGRIERLTGLPPWRMSFNPNHFGDPYTKKTLLWGRFNGDLPVAPVEPTEGSKMHRLYGGKSQATKNARSVTPEGFAYAFFMANNAVDNPVMAVANKYDMMDRKVFEEAVDAGMSYQQIAEVVDDPYYMDLNYEAAADALRARIQEIKGKADKIVEETQVPDGMSVHVFKTSDGYGAGLFDAESGNYVTGSIIRYKGSDALTKAKQKAREIAAEATPLPYTAEQRKDAEDHASEIGGEIAWQEGKYALIRGYSVLTGDPVYVPTMGTSRARVDIKSFTGTQLPDDVRQKMLAAKEQVEADAVKRHESNPFIKFENGVALSADIDPSIAGVVREWKDLLKLDVPIYVSTIDDAKANRDNFTGPHRRIGSGTLDANELGSMRRMSDGSFYILFKQSTSPTRMLETIAHEMGHLHERLFFYTATPEEQKALRDAHQKFLESQKGKTAAEFIGALRGRSVGRVMKGSVSQPESELSSYWKSFGEWYADQVSKWALSSAKPVSIVEKYFKRLAIQLRRFFQQLKARKYLPDETFAQYIEKATERPANLEPGGPDRAERMSRLDLDFKDVIKRTPELQEGMRKLQAGEITKEDYALLVSKYKPVEPYAKAPAPTAPEKARFALANGKGQSEAKAAKFGLPSREMQEGEAAQLRLDIPSYSQHGAWVVSVHRPEGKSFKAGPVVGYESVASVKDAKFGMQEEAAAKIAAGSAKGTIATIVGSWVPTTSAEAKAKADKAIKSKDWAQVGMDPERHSYFYNRKTMQPVVSADEVIQIGPLVLAKNAKYGTRESFLFNIDPSAFRGQLGFYSALSAGVDGLNVSSAPVQGWKDAIKGLVNKGQVKQDEVEWSGVNDWLDLQQGKVTKEQVSEYLTQGGVQVEETVLGGDDDTLEARIARLNEKLRGSIYEAQDDGDGGIFFLGDDGTSYDFDSLPAAIRRRLSGADIEARADGLPKYGQYTLPGGKNYREVLLTLPAKQGPRPDDVARQMFGRRYNDLTPYQQDQVRRMAKANDEANYRSNHWDQPNVLAHIRLNDRTDSDGKRVLFVEEIQSDWGQEGKKKGFKDSEKRVEWDDPEYADARRRVMELTNEFNRNNANPERQREIEPLLNDARALELSFVERNNRIDAMIPAAPFVTKTEGWLNLALKRIMVMAAEGGYDRVAFINGEQSADRYDLSKQADYIQWNPGYDGRKLVQIETLDGTIIGFAVLTDGTIDDSTRGWDGKQIDEVIGKELATKIMAKDSGDLRGLDLKLGGEGMKTFYDKIVPMALNKLLPKVGGGKAKTVEVGGEKKVTYEDIKAAERRRDFDEAERLTLIMERQELGRGKSDAGEYQAMQQLGFDVTDKMRAQVERGLPLFSIQEPSLAEQEGDLLFTSAEIRAEKIKQYAKLRASVARMTKQVAEGKASIDLQRNLTETMQAMRELQAEIKATVPRSDSPEDFYAKALKEYSAGNISEDVLDVIKAMYQRHPEFLEGLRLSVTEKKGGPAVGSFIPWERIVRLYKSTSGVNDPRTIKHELAHSLEQIMTPEQRKVIIQAWGKALQRAIKQNPGEKHQKFFNAVIKFIANPTELRMREAIDLLPSYDMYQYINPSEYWAVNAEKLMGSQLGSAWDRFKMAVRRLFEAMKKVLGFDNRSDVHNVFRRVMKGETERRKDTVLVDLLGSGKFKLENIDEEDLVNRYNRPNTPRLDHSPIRTFITNQFKNGKEVIKDGTQNPRAFVSGLGDSVMDGMIAARTKSVWYGAGLEARDFERYKGQLRTDEDIVTASVALDNAIRSGNIGVEVVFRGGLKYDPKAGNFVAFERDKGMRGVYEAEAKLKKRLGDQLGTDIIQGYLEAKRSISIMNELYDREAALEAAKQDRDALRNLTKTIIGDKTDHLMKVAAAEARVDDLEVELDSIKKAASSVNMSEDEMNEFAALDQKHSELRDIMDNWTAVNQNLLRVWRQVGLLSQGRYERLSAIKDYVPWYRIMNDNEDLHSADQTAVGSTTRSMTNIGRERLFKRGKPLSVVDVRAKEGQKDFRIQPSSVIRVRVNGDLVDPQLVSATPDGKVRIDLDLKENDLVVFETNREIQNIIDNMTRNVMRMTMNGIRQFAANRIVLEYASRNEKDKIMVFPSVDPKKGRFNWVVNGKKVVVEIQDPLVAASIYGMENLNLRMIAPLAAVANLTRRSITLSGVFQIKQVFKDAPTAALVTGVRNPLALIGGVWKGFLTSLAQPATKAAGVEIEPVVDILKRAGIGGFHSPARTPEAEIKRRMGIMNRNVFSALIKGLDHIGDSSDMAQRVATYKRVMAETGDEAQALFQAANVINFLHHGSSGAAQAAVKLVPFLGAYANSTDVLVRALMGGGLKGMSRKKALARLATTATLLSSMTILYCMLASLDPEYDELDDQTKLRNIVIPFTKIMLPMNTSAAFFFKAIPELIFNAVTREGTDNEFDRRRLLRALGEVARDSLLGPEPVPAGIKPILEVAINHSFFTGRPIIPEGLKDVEDAEKYVESTSELGKQISAMSAIPGTDKRAISPIAADHLVRGIFGTTGAMVQWITNSIGAMEGTRPELKAKEMPITGAFLRDEVPRGNEDLYYDFKQIIEQKYKTLNKMIEREDDEAADAYLDKHGDIIGMHDYIRDTERDLQDINAEIRRLGTTRSKLETPKERRKEIEELQRERQELLAPVKEFRREVLK